MNDFDIVVQYPKGRKLLIEQLTTKDNYLKDQKYFQCNYTPDIIANKLISKVDNIKKKKICVIFNLEIVEDLIHTHNVSEKNITYIADNKVKKEFCKAIYGTKTKLLKNYSVQGVYEIMGKKMFDVVLSNPPYNKNIDIKILKEIVPLSKELVIVHPSTWLIDTKRKSKLYNDFRDQINGKLKSVEMFNGNKIFNIGLFVPITITHIDNNYNGSCDVKYLGDNFTVNNIYDITKFGNSWKSIVKPFMNKVKNLDNIWNHKVYKENIDDTKFHCQLSGIAGNWDKSYKRMYKDDFYTMLMKDTNCNKGIRNHNTTAFLVWEFDTEIERDNFISYLKTDFSRFCLAIYKNSQSNHRGEMELIPMMDFTQEWNDEKLYEYFNIDKKTQEYITNFLPYYHNIRSTNG